MLRDFFLTRNYHTRGNSLRLALALRLPLPLHHLAQLLGFRGRLSGRRFCCMFLRSKLTDPTIEPGGRPAPLFFR